MSTTTTAPAVAAPIPESDSAPTTTEPTLSDEQRHIASLKHISALQKQLSALRTTIPSILGPALSTAQSARQRQRASAHEAYISTIYAHETDEAIPNRSEISSTVVHYRTPRDETARRSNDTYALLMAAARKSMKDVAAFRKEWTSDTTQEMLRRAKESAARDADLQPGKDVEQY